MTLDSKVPSGRSPRSGTGTSSSRSWSTRPTAASSPVIVVGTGLAGASAAASLGELGYNVMSFCIHDSPRRAHSIAAQGGINAAKNYQNDGDSIYRLFYDTVKGGDYRAREANVYRLAQVSVNIIDQCVAQGVPFAREYGGLLDNRSFGGAQVSRTFYARGQTGQQLLLGAYQSLMRQVDAGTVTLFAAPRDARPGRRRRPGARHRLPQPRHRRARDATSADAVLLCTGGYGTVYYLSTNAVNSQRHGGLARAQARRAASPIPASRRSTRPASRCRGDYQSKLTLMSEILRNDGRVWVPKKQGDKRPPQQIPEAERDYYLERRYPELRQPRAARRRVTRRQGGLRRRPRRRRDAAWRSISTSPTPSSGSARTSSRERYGNLFDMYQKITDEDPYKVPMRIYPAVHYTMGGLWVDYNLMSTIPGLLVLGEANFSDHGANRLGASALMQGLADGYFVIPYTLAPLPRQHDAAEGDDRPRRVRGGRAATRRRRIDTHAVGQGQQDASRAAPRARPHPVGPRRHGAQRRRPAEGPGARFRRLRDEFWQNVSVPGEPNNLNKNLEYAGRVADYLEFARAAGPRRARRATNPAAATSARSTRRPTARPSATTRTSRYVAAWEFTGVGQPPELPRGAACVRVRETVAAELQVGPECASTFESGGRQARPLPGRLETTRRSRSRPDMSFLEMLDVVNEDLIRKGEDPIAFDSDCREGICGTCGFVVNGAAARARLAAPPLPVAHAPLARTATRSPSSRGAPRRSRS